MNANIYSHIFITLHNLSLQHLMGCKSITTSRTRRGWIMIIRCEQFLSDNAFHVFFHIDVLSEGP